MSESTNRRNFLKLAATGMAAVGLSGLTKSASGLVVPPAAVTPSRKGTTAMGMRCEPIQKVRIGIIGLGMRGADAVTRLMQVEGTEIKAVCDVIPERVKKSQEDVTKTGAKAPAGYANGPDDWQNLCKRDDIDLVYICTPWEQHTPNAVFAMKNGKHAAIEVPAALTVEECWELVDTSEETRKHCMMLENCCYDFFELSTLMMARKGILGELMHAEAAYIHDLRWLKFDKENGYQDMWRLKYSQYHTGNPYPTHGLGPVAQAMGINQGDRFEYLTSVSTNQVGMSQYAINKFGTGSAEAKQIYRLGDMNTTVVKTTNGKTIMIQHDTTSPRPYSRIHLLSGTNGIAQKWPEEKIALEPNAHSWLKKDEFDKLMAENQHPLTIKIGDKAKKVGGHGGMDFIMDYRLIYCLRNGLPLDQTVYDAAAWSSIVELSEKSVLNRGTSVEIPDFTRGEWTRTKAWDIVSVE